MGINQGPISLDQKYTQETGHVFTTGIQALVRLPMAQIRRDRANGLNTAGFISGYRGSPLGGYDQQLFAARKHLEQYNIKFQPGVNEDLAATAVWGSQQLNLSPGAKYDGVVGIWYGKGPGVDRCGDVFRHGNAAGSAKNGGVLCSGRRRPRRKILDRSASVRPRLHVGADAVSLSLQHPRDDRDGPARHRDVALFGLLGRHEGDHGDGGDHRRDRPHRRDEAVHHPARFRAAARWPQSALARRPLRAGPPPPGLQGLCRDRLCARQQGQPRHHGFAERPLRHHGVGQEL